MIKDMLVHLKLGEGPDPAADYAVSMAAALGAQLTGVAISFEIDVPHVYTEAFSTDFIDLQRAENRRLSAQASARFEEAARSMGVVADVRVIDGTLGGAAEQIATIARLYDLTVVSQADPSRMGTEEVVTEAILFDSGRAVLLVPLEQAHPYSGERVMVAWDGGRAAARAVAEARPFLSRASLVEAVVVANAKHKNDELPGADLARHLARHEKNVELRRLVPAHDEGIVDVLLKEVAERNIDLMVMGGYGHSRLREFVLGGVTRDMLERMSVPLLMAH